MGCWLLFCAVLGPYTIEYTSNGRYMLVGGRKGHLAMMDMLNMDLIKEFQVNFLLLKHLNFPLFSSCSCSATLEELFFLLVWECC